MQTYNILTRQLTYFIFQPSFGLQRLNNEKQLFTLNSTLGHIDLRLPSTIRITPSTCNATYLFLVENNNARTYFGTTAAVVASMSYSLTGVHW